MNDRTTGRATAGWRIVAVCGLASFTLYALTVCPTVSFGDAGELIGAASSLGVAHPPGYPLYTMLGWAALQLPFGQPALRTNLMSALFAALACAVAAWLVRRLTGSTPGALAAGLLLATSSTFWSVATVTEVYTLHLLLMLAMLSGSAVVGDGTSRRERGLGLIVAATALGAGLSHHPTIVIALPAAALLAWRPPVNPATTERRRPDFPAWSLWIAALVVLGLPVLFDGGMMLRARREPLANWGRPVDLPALWNHVTAVAYRHLDLGWSGLLRGSSWATLGRLVLWEMTPLAPALALLGLSLGCKRVRLAVVALIGCGAIFGLRYTAQDIEVFYLPVFAGVALAVGLGIARMFAAPGATLRRAGWAATILAVLLPAVFNYNSHDLRGATGAADYGRDILETLPPGATLFVETDDAFPLIYLTQVLDERSDVRVFQRDGILFDNAVEEMQIPAQRGEPWGAYRNRVEQALIDRELSGTSPAGVFFLGWPGYDAPPHYRLEPIGLLYRFSAASAPPVDLQAVWDGYAEETIRAQALRTGDSFALAAAATYAAARGERAMHDGNFELAESEFERATRLGAWGAQLHNYVGLVYARFNRYDRAIDMFRRATEAQPTSIQAWNNLGKASFLAGDLEQARRAWSRSLEVLPGQAGIVDSLRQLDEPR